MRLIDYMNQGGIIMYILLGLNIIGFAIMLAKFYVFAGEKKKSSERAQEIAKVLEKEIVGKDTTATIEITKKELATYISRLEKGLNTIKVIASISPLLGLLGTVLGVLIAFNIMAQKGLTDPSYFAQGISMALLTTVGGMIVAIPHYVGHNYLIGLLDQIESAIENRLIKLVTK